MVISSDNYGQILTKGDLDFIQWNYIHEVDVEGMIDVKKKNSFSKRMEGDRVLKFSLKYKGAKQGILWWSRGKDVLFLKLLSTFLLPNDGNS